jgi:hypothetical protein
MAVIEKKTFVTSLFIDTDASEDCGMARLMLDFEVLKEKLDEILHEYVDEKKNLVDILLKKMEQGCLTGNEALILQVVGINSYLDHLEKSGSDIQRRD